MRRFHCLKGFVLALLSLAAAANAQDANSYGYARTLEGSATVTRVDGEEPTTLVVNYPLQVGDLVQTDSYAAVELVLPDFNVVRLGAVADVELRELAFSADSDDRRTVLGLARGELQLVVTEHALGDELPRIETPNATLYIHEPGTYVVEHDGWEQTRLVVREGYAEALTERGTAVVRAGEEVVVEGLERPDVTVLAAGPASSLEAWGSEFAAGAEASPAGGVDPALAYSATALEESGEWVEVEGGTAWRPHVEIGWRPYTRGTWVSTYSGLTWVGHEPWAWLTGHYGYWAPHPIWGWIWHPGFIYSPAWVYWYWGPDWVGWVPRGYYGHHYRPYHHFYGWAGGSWSFYASWTFCPTQYFGHGHGHHHYRGGHQMAKYSGLPAVPRGVIATETRGITRAQWRDGAAVGSILATRAGGASGTRPPDLTDFVAGRTAPPAPRAAVRSDAPAVVRQGWRDSGRQPLVRRAHVRNPHERLPHERPPHERQSREAMGDQRTRQLTADAESLEPRPSIRSERDRGRPASEPDHGDRAGWRSRIVRERAAEPAISGRSPAAPSPGRSLDVSAGDAGRGHDGRFGSGAVRDDDRQGWRSLSGYHPPATSRGNWQPPDAASGFGRTAEPRELSGGSFRRDASSPARRVIDRVLSRRRGDIGERSPTAPRARPKIDESTRRSVSKPASPRREQRSTSSTRSTTRSPDRRQSASRGGRSQRSSRAAGAPRSRDGGSARSGRSRDRGSRDRGRDG